MNNLARFKYFIQERYQIYLNKQRGLPKPWTEDKILQSYRFCNVYRENDSVTEWIRKNWRIPNKGNPDLWFAMVVARYINWPDTLKEIGFPVPWSAHKFKQVMEDRLVNHEKLFTGAYIIHSLGPKIPYLANKVFTPLWNHRKEVRPRPGETLQEFYDRLRGFRGMGSFMAAQVVADIKYSCPLNTAEDWWSWAAMGPGSARGLGRLLYDDPKYKWKGKHWNQSLRELQEEIQVFMRDNELPPIHAQDIQNCLCEFDKYERVRLGEGKPRSKYAGV